jgi:hypothetical protein
MPLLVFSVQFLVGSGLLIGNVLASAIVKVMDQVVVANEK